MICKVFLHGCVTFWNYERLYILLLYIFVNYEAKKKIINHEPAPKWRAKISPLWLHLFGCYSLPLLSPAPNKYVHDLLCVYHCFGFYEVLSHVYTHKDIHNSFSLKYHHTKYISHFLFPLNIWFWELPTPFYETTVCSFSLLHKSSVLWISVSIILSIHISAVSSFLIT